MMIEFSWIKMSLFLILVLQFTVTGHGVLVRYGNEATLSCALGLIDNQDNCDSFSWHFTSSNTPTTELIARGQINKNAKSARLSDTEKCSLVIKKVTLEDVGFYTCREIPSRQDANVYLFVVTMTEQKNNDKTTLSCSVVTYGGCRHTAKWLYDNMDKDKDVTTSETDCLATVTFLTSYLKQKSEYHKLFKCEVTNLDTYEKKRFNFSRQSSGEKPGEETTTEKATLTIRTTENIYETMANPTAPAVEDLWLYIIVASGLALVVLVIIIVTVIWLKRTKGNKTQMDENTGQRLNPAGTESAPETSQYMADPEDGVSYASISYTRRTNSKARVQVKNDDDDDEDDTVTYSTVKASSSAAGASDDPSTLYSTINKPDK